MTRSTTVCVIGGGLAGLVTAHSLVARRPGLEVTILEASDRLGGALRTESIEGAVVEAGADSFLTRSPEAIELCESLGLGGELVAPAIFGASIWSGGRLTELPPDFVMGMPSSMGSALGAAHLSAWGRIRAAAEPALPGRVHGDVGVGELVRRRYGREVLERSVDPLLAGTRAGRPEEISLQAAFPQIWSLVRGRRSITRALKRARATRAIEAGPPAFKSVAGGLERIVGALAEQSKGVEVVANAHVETVAERGDAFRASTTAGDVDAAAVVAAVPAFEAARAFRSLRPSAASLLERIEFASVATIALVYDASDEAARLPGSGMLVPSHASTTMSACTWYSLKWPESTPAGGGLVLRCFVGRAGESDALELTDDELVAAVARDVRIVAGLPGKPRSALVTRWPRGLPQYRVGHAGLVDEIESLLQATPGAWVTGASYRGSGIPDCIRHAQQTAGRVLEWLEP